MSLKIFLSAIFLKVFSHFQNKPNFESVKFLSNFPRNLDLGDVSNPKSNFMGNTLGQNEKLDWKSEGTVVLRSIKFDLGFDTCPKLGLTRG